MIKYKNKVITTFLSLAIIFTLFNCKAVQNANNKQKGAVIGATGGAVLGAIIGNNVGKGGNGELGAVIGGVIRPVEASFFDDKLDQGITKSVLNFKNYE